MSKRGKGKRGHKGGGMPNRRDEDERAQRTQEKGDRAQQGNEREEASRSGSRSGTGSGGEPGRKGNER